MRRRLVAAATAVALLVAVAFAVPLAWLVREVARDRARVELERDVAALAPVLAVTTDPALVETALRGTSTGHAGRLAIWLPSGTVVGRVTAADDEGVALARQDQRAFSSVAYDRLGGLRLFTPVLTGDGSVAVLRGRILGADLTRGVRTAWAALAAVAIGLVAAAVGVADRLGRAATRPTEQLADAARRLAAGDRLARAPVGGPPEIVDAAQAFNRLAARIDELMALERERVADLSHRLRTPLAALRLNAEAQASAELRADLERLERAVDDLIRQARRPLDKSLPSGCDAGAIVSERSRFWGALADDQGRVWRCRIEPDDGTPSLIAVSEADLGAAVDVLIENVFAHTEEGTAYRVELTRSSRDVTIAVADAGIGLADPMAVVRGRSSVGSTGLGLDIVRQLAGDAGGRFAVTRSDLGGLRAVLVLPLASVP